MSLELKQHKSKEGRKEREKKREKAFSSHRHVGDSNEETDTEDELQIPDEKDDKTRELEAIFPAQLQPLPVSHATPPQQPLTTTQRVVAPSSAVLPVQAADAAGEREIVKPQAEVEKKVGEKASSSGRGIGGSGTIEGKREGREDAEKSETAVVNQELPASRNTPPREL